MRITLVHGYFLHDSGSGVYTRELARSLVRRGHEVTLVCQDREPGRCDFIDSAFVLDQTNSAVAQIYSAPGTGPGTCRLVRPDLSGELMVYVAGVFPPFERGCTHTFQDASPAQRDSYIQRNVDALRTVFAMWPPDLVLAQHIIMQPYEVAAALGGRAPYVVTEHGSALNFSVRGNAELVPFAVEGLRQATCIATVSDGARIDLIAWGARHGIDLSRKTLTLQPGVDGELFAPAESRDEALEHLATVVPASTGLQVTPAEDVVAFVGALRPTKGVQHLVAAMPLVSQMRGRPVRLLVAGDGPARDSLAELGALLGRGDAAGAARLVDLDARLQSPKVWGDVVAGTSPLWTERDLALLGHLEHEQVAAVFAAADLCVTSSVFPEAAALVNVEGLSAGALPLATYHSGMVNLDDFLAEKLHDDAFRQLATSPEFTRLMARLICHVLETYPTKDTAFRRRIHALATERYPTWDVTADTYASFAAAPAGTSAPGR